MTSTLTPPTPETAAIEANNSEPTGRFMLLEAVPVNPLPNNQAPTRPRNNQAHRMRFADLR